MKAEFWKNKSVLITGNTGFKGAWLCELLLQLGAKPTGFSLPPPTDPSLFSLANIQQRVPTVAGDIRDTEALTACLRDVQPEIILHMAAQSVVLDSYREPIESFSTNVVGTASVLEAVRRAGIRCSIVNVTTDKVYANKGWVWGYRETDMLGGNDPYSSSKACAELVAQSFRNSFFPISNHHEHGVAIGSARAGNVIGGGDWTPHQLIPETVASFARHEPVTLRNPSATRPWQHVLDCLSGYLTLAEHLEQNPLHASGEWNFGPRDRHPPTVSRVVELLSKPWKMQTAWQSSTGQHLHEERALSLDSSKAELALNWQCQLSVEEAISWVADWYVPFQQGDAPATLIQAQVSKYLKLWN